MATPQQAARLALQDLVVLGSRIRDARQAGGLGQADVASAAGISISYMSRIEAGKRRCDLSLLSKIAERLGVSIDSLVDQDGPSTDLASEAAVRSPELEFAEIALEMGEPQAALKRLDAIVSTAEEPGARDLALLRGRALESLGRLDEALAVLEGLRLPGPDPLADVAIAIVLSRCYRESGERVRAIRVGEDALTALAAVGLDGGDEAVQLAVTVAAAYFEQGDRDYARRMCQRVLAAAEKLGSPRARASAYWNCAIMDLEGGHSASAVQMARRALALLGEGKDQRNLGRLHGELGLMELRVSPPAIDEAERHLQQSRILLTQSSGGEVDLQHVESSWAELELVRGEPTEALARALGVAATVHGRAPQVEAQALLTAGSAALSLGDTEQAHGLFVQSVQALVSLDDLRGVAQLWLELGERLRSLGDFEAAADAFQRATAAAGLVPATRPASTSKPVADPLV